ncbi:hypothetical protein AALB16_11085 [Lachnospiraceae bacterium 62-35]
MNKQKKMKIQLILFSETKMREDVYQARKGIQERELRKHLEVLSEVFDVNYVEECEIRSKRQGLELAKKVNGGEGPVILYIPIFINPSIVAHTAKAIHKPMALVGNHARDSLSQVGFLAAAGAMDQLGIIYKRISYDGGTKEAAAELSAWSNAANAAEALNGQTFGCIGGRSLGISTGTADLALWENLFGVDIEHIDQLEVVNRGAQVPEEEIDTYVRFIEERYGKVDYDEGKNFSQSHLRKMIASYLATQNIIREYELDFIGIKCQTELSNHYCLQCLNVQMTNDPYDACGEKCPIACSCEADADGALSMQILKLISGGKPTALQDIANITPERFVLANCGAMASYFTALSEDADENLKEVHLMPHGFGMAGGAATQFVCGAGLFTYMRLFRKNGGYQMAFFTGKTIKEDREMIKQYSPYRPTAFVEHHVDLNQFMKVYSSNHIHCVEGDYTADLEEFCRLKGIPFYHL